MSVKEKGRSIDGSVGQWISTTDWHNYWCWGSSRNIPFYWLCCLSCLPKEFKNFRVAIEFRDDISEISVIKTKQEDARREGNNMEKSAALYTHISNTNKKESKNNKRQFHVAVPSIIVSSMWKCFKYGKVGYRVSVYQIKT